MTDTNKPIINVDQQNHQIQNFPRMLVYKAESQKLHFIILDSVANFGYLGKSNISEMTMKILASFLVKMAKIDE